jgi:TolA-binding protein
MRSAPLLVTLALAALGLASGCPGRGGAGPAAPTAGSPAADPGADLDAIDLGPADRRPGDASDGPDERLAGVGPRTVHDLDVVHLDVVGYQDGEAQIEASTPGPLLDKGNEAFVAKDYAGAISWYRQLVDEFSDSALAPVALYNIALAEEQRGDVTAAIAAYREIGRAFPRATEAVDGLLRAAALLAERGSWSDAATTLAEVIARDDLSRELRLEAQARLGYVRLEQGQLDEAERELAAAVEVWRKANRVEDPYYIAMAHFYLGEVALRRFEQAPLRSSDAELAADMEARRVLVMRAYGHWKEALEHKHAYWATAAGYQMSQVFYEYWKVAVKAPYPDGLDPAGRQAYVIEVHDRMRENLTKALEGHQANVELAGAYGVETRWSEASKVRATELLGVLDREARGDLVRP